MFQITRDPSSGSVNLHLTEITYNGSQLLVMSVVGVWLHMPPNTMIAVWPERLKACAEAEGGHFEWHYYK
jgi:hypothetical protein